MNKRRPCIRVNESKAIRSWLKEVLKETGSENRTTICLAENLARTNDGTKVRVKNLSRNLSRKNLNLILSREPRIGRSV